MNRNLEVVKSRGKGRQRRAEMDPGAKWCFRRLKLKEKNGQWAILGARLTGRLSRTEVSINILSNYLCFCQLTAICLPTCPVKCAAAHQMLYVRRLWRSPGKGRDSMARLVRVYGKHRSRRLREDRGTIGAHSPRRP